MITLMIDVKLLRENPDDVRSAVEKKKFTCDLDAILGLDSRRRAVISESEKARAQQKAANTKMASLPKGSPEFLAKVAEMKTLSASVKTLQNQQQEIEQEWTQALLNIPNLPHESVPLGRGEDSNVVIKTWGEADIPEYARPHYELSIFRNGVDLEHGVKVTGAGFPFFIGDMARLMRALIQFCLNEAHRAGYIEIMPPLLVNAVSATATGQLPDKEGQMYRLVEDPFYLIPTAEVPVTNLYRDATLSAEELPIKHVAYTPCFRREAGSYGRDVRGLNRLHQFDKVELVKWVHPDTSFDELETLRADAESLLQKLELPYRVLEICTGDLGFPHAKQYDLEAWSPGQQRWLEVSSCSNFTDFQARRANIRYRSGSDKPQIVHTLNGSGLGLPRIFAAILENYLQEDGSIAVPTVLQPLFGSKRIEA